MAKTIMVVDDENTVLAFVGELLKSAGYKVIPVMTGEDALEKLKTTKPDLIIIDFFMPEMNGKELLEKIRKNSNLKNIKIVFLTIKRASKAELEELKTKGVLCYIAKPFDVKDLIRKIEKII